MDGRQVSGTDGEITVRRDEWGIPHASATSSRDAFFAQGFVQAEDRLGQLEYDRRRAYGRWAEVAGVSAAAFDVFARRCGLGVAARREYEALDDAAREALDAFAAGVNAWLALDRPLPPDLALAGVAPEPWMPWDCCAVFLVRHVVFASWQKKLWRGRLAVLLGPEAVARLEDADPRAVPLIVPPGELFRAESTDPAALEVVAGAMAAVAEASAGSNAWALSGERCKSGKPLLAGDPHRVVEVPGVYAQGHFACPDFDAVGLSFVGVPGFPHFGHNERVAWCVTNANGDYQDLYVERFAQGDPLRYEAGGKWREARRHQETVLVRDAEPVVVECVETRHGPVVFGDPASGYALALRSTALVEPSSGLSALTPMLSARSVDELEDAMRCWVDPVNNLVSADIDGNISYRTIGQVPVRAEANTWGPVPGWTDDHEWTGVVPLDELPRLRNPESGLIVTANQRIVGDGYPHYIGRDASRPDRAQRLHERLDGMFDATVDDMASVHRDRRSLAADVWVERLVGLTGSDQWERAALDELRGWDRSVDADSAAAAVYVVVRDAAGRIVAHAPTLAALRAPLADEPPGAYQPLESRLWVLLTGLLARDDPILLGGHESWDALLGSALTDGVAVLRARLGDDVRSWKWGALHRLVPAHPLGVVHPDWAAHLDPPGVGIGGEWDTVFSASHRAGFGFEVLSASVARYVFDLGEWDASAWVVPHGASGDVTSPHFADQQGTWAAGELLPMRYRSVNLTR